MGSKYRRIIESSNNVDYIQIFNKEKTVLKAGNA